jgi:hypothetical protein
MAGLDPAIHVLQIEKKVVDARVIGGAEATPSFGRLCPGMTNLDNFAAGRNIQALSGGHGITA